MPPEIERATLQRLSSQLSRGEVILFTGAGFSRDAVGRSGSSLPSVDELKAALRGIALPGQGEDDGSSLGDLFELAVSTAQNRTRQLLEERLRVDGNALPEEYRVWFSMPWARVYTLNMDDLDEVVSRTFELPRGLEVVSAINEAPLSSSTKLLSVHLNGVLDDFPDVTFSQSQYGERLAQPDLWYQALVRDVRAAPVLFVGTTLDEPPLWRYIELRGRRGGGRELRPGSYLVTPRLPAARSAILKDHFNVELIPMKQGDFARDVLTQLDEAQREGIRFWAARRSITSDEQILRPVSELRRQPTQDLREYVMGREPTWADLGPDGYAVQRSFEAQIEDAITEEEARVLILTGTGGAGKTTTLMRFGLERQASGQDVRWIDLEGHVSIPRLRQSVRDASPDLVLLDDAESFGNQAGPLIAELVSDNDDLFVATTVRASRYESLNIEARLADVSFAQVSIPHLGDEDIDLLLDTLMRAQRLGQLRGLPRAEQAKALQQEAGRQLLVAMIQATSGELFEEKIDRECRDLEPPTALLYAIVALATAQREYLTRQTVLLASGDASNEAINRLQGLVNQHLVTVTGGSQLRVRHRLIAERALDYFRSNRLLGEPIRGLMFALASSIDPARYPRGRESSFLVRLLNHGWLIRNLPGDREAVRAAYDAVEDLLSWDYHYWLQRGSFEVEVGDLQLAQNLLEQARALAPEDYKVQTEWAYMIIKRAAQNAASPESRDRVEEAFLELEDAVTRRGHIDSYPAHVMGSQGLSWVRQAPLTQDEKLGILARLRGVVDQALHHHPASGDLRQLSRDLEQEYLLVGAVRQA